MIDIMKYCPLWAERIIRDNKVLLKGSRKLIKLLKFIDYLKEGLIIPKLYYKTFNKKNDLKVNIGGGLFVRKGWKVLDYHTSWYDYSNIFIDYNFDLCTNKQMPFKDNSVDYFYSSHTFEHIPNRYC